MKTSRYHLAQVIAQRTLQIKDTKKLSRELAAYLLEENMVADIEPLMRDIIQYRAEHGIVEATAVSVNELSQVVLSEVKDIMHDRYGKSAKLVLLERQDPELIGGIKIELPNEQLDLSVKTKINTFKHLAESGIK